MITPAVLYEAAQFAPSMKACDVGGCWVLRCDEHNVVTRGAMEPRHCREVLPQLLTVARVQGLTELLDGLACDLVCLR
jgi:hypothetical protein